MTPSARVAAAIEILDLIQSGQPAEKTLTGWGRANRYAGSGDRRAIRDHVFTVLRQKRSLGYIGGSENGRGLMLGWAISEGIDPGTLFTGEKYAPAAIEPDEVSEKDLKKAPREVQQDCPDWLIPKFDKDLGKDCDQVLSLLKLRAPVFLRVNAARSTVEKAQAMLEADGVKTTAHPLSPMALEVTENPRRVAQGAAYKDGLVELQDAASQAVVDFLPYRPGQRVLDYCAGGGGKSLAMAARHQCNVTAYDANPERMTDLGKRATRAQVAINITDLEDLDGKTFDLVLCDVPCSGSGSWRRSPDAKWTLTPDRLAELVVLQSSIMDGAAINVADKGHLAYVTCSVFSDENKCQIDGFLARNEGWKLDKSHQFSPLDGGDGFFVALLKRV